MSYTGMKKPELQTEARKRELPTTGTVEELIARLEADDQAKAGASTDEPDLTALGDDDAPDVPDAPETPTVEPQTGPAPDANTSGAEAPNEPSGVDGQGGGVGAPVRGRGVFRTEFKVQGGELSDGVHQDFRRQTVEQARAAGRDPIQGTAGARLLGLETRVDGTYGIYEIHVRQAF